MLVSSVVQSLDKRLVVGKTSTKAISLLNVLKKSFEYAITKYNSGEEDYFKIITQLNLKIQKLKYECPDICSFRDKFIFEKTAFKEDSHIENNTIPLSTASTLQTLPYGEIIKGMALNDVGSIQIVEKSPAIDLYVDGLPVQENHIYSAGVSFNAVLNKDFLYENYIEEGVCKTVKINRDSLEQELREGHRVLGLDSSGNTIIQTLVPRLYFKTIDSTVFNDIRENFKVRVTDTKNNNLWTNTATIDLVFSPTCETYDCLNKNIEVVSEHADEFTFSMEDLYEGTIDRIKIKNITFTSGILIFNNQEYPSNSNLEIVVTKEDLIANSLIWRYVPVLENTLIIEYTIPSINDFNYCDINSTFELTKLQG